MPISTIFNRHGADCESIQNAHNNCIGTSSGIGCFAPN
ncbi:hypothetical protein VTN49DRAFT_6562 [Thermomyces lanuginosus]